MIENFGLTLVRSSYVPDHPMGKLPIPTAFQSDLTYGAENIGYWKE
jgi:hypothetical protein